MPTMNDLKQEVLHLPIGSCQGAGGCILPMAVFPYDNASLSQIRAESMSAQDKMILVRQSYPVKLDQNRPILNRNYIT